MSAQQKFTCTNFGEVCQLCHPCFLGVMVRLSRVHNRVEIHTFPVPEMFFRIRTNAAFAGMCLVIALASVILSL